MYDGVSEHVLERRQHLVEHLPIQFARCSLDGEFAALFGLFGDLPDEPRKPRHMAVERHHACSHQAVLQLGRNA